VDLFAHVQRCDHAGLDRDLSSVRVHSAAYTWHLKRRARSAGLLGTNDSFGGVFLQTLCRRLRSPYLIIEQSTPREHRLEQLVGGLLQHRRMTIAADYGRPWYVARPTSGQLAIGTQGYIVATRLEPRRKWRGPMGKAGGAAYLPLPFSAYAMWFGEPRRANDARLDDDLWELRERTWFTRSAA